LYSLKLASAGVTPVIEAVGRDPDDFGEMELEPPPPQPAKAPRMARGMKTREVNVHGRIVAPAEWDFISSIKKMETYC
jgi:hypothetical protein